jgi:S-adenosylmethionine:tRNA ribosyltransferase-isomerase
METHLNELNLEQFNYELPDDKISKFPLAQRDQSKLLVFRNSKIEVTTFENIAKFLPKDSHLVFNNTKVIPARLFFQNKTGANIEILLLQPFDNEYAKSFSETKSSTWECMIGNKKKWKPNEVLHKSVVFENIKIDINVESINSEKNILKFEWKSNENELTFAELLQYLGEIPLPPYLNRKPTISDSDTYQTVYSKINGAIAAPTAGLHFTNNTFESLANSNISTQFITLHVGAGTFLPIKEKNVINHKMHREQIIFHKQEIETLIEKIEKIIPVGTTSMRALESLFWFGVKIQESNAVLNEKVDFFIEKLYPYICREITSPTDSLKTILNYMNMNQLEVIIGETEILIVPSYSFKLCKGIITNFHQPQSTLLLLISALVGEYWKSIYEFALNNNFRFLSYGDSSLLLPNN